MSAIRRSAIVPFSDAEMFALVADIASYPKFLPWCSDARILKAEEGAVEAALTIAYRGVHKTFTTRNVWQTDKAMEIRLVEGPFRHLHGFWRFTALAVRASKVELDLDFEVANRLLSTVLTPVFTHIAGQLVDAFHARANALYGQR
ncbi:MAG: type II toxin-antitoxin system RatA family toxin [Sulfurifustaceae bacterium]